MRMVFTLKNFEKVSLLFLGGGTGATNVLIFALKHLLLQNENFCQTVKD